ncbi:MAG: DUF3500 domain-containing protein [Phycisphaerales bacterium]|nr:DUF3500 domain-containing protein [Phycisphaerales bacterium]
MITSLLTLLLGSFLVFPGKTTDTAARALVESLSPTQRTELVFPFESRERIHWMYLPGDRSGLPLRDMTPAQKEGVHDVLSTVLSEQGMLDLQGIYAMEVALRDASRRNGREDPSRDPDQYEFAVFGTPGSGPWSWHYEGHHLSLNFTHVDGDTAVTPLFIGVAPFEIPSGPHQGMKVLGEESEAGFALLRALDDEQRARAIIANRPPGDVHTRPGQPHRLASPKGLPLSEASPAQQELAMAIFREYVDILHGPMASAEMERVQAAGPGNIHFAWMGSTEVDKPHYFRLHGPTFILEYDCVGGDPNHVHVVWHDPDRNFGADLLQRHHEQHHQTKGAEQHNPGTDTSR